MICEETTGLILKGFYKVYSTLGYGFLEKVYENALMIELAGLGLRFADEHSTLQARFQVAQLLYK